MILIKQNKKDVAEVLANRATSLEPSEKAYTYSTPQERITTREQALERLQREDKNKKRPLYLY